MTVVAVTSTTLADSLRGEDLEPRLVGADGPPGPADLPGDCDVLVLEAERLGYALPLYTLFQLPLAAPASLETADGCVPRTTDVAALRAAIARVGDRAARERRLAAIVASTADATYDVLLPEGPIAWEGDIESLIGVPAATFARDTSGWLARVLPEDHAALVAAMEHSLRSHQPYDFSYRVRHEDGSWRVWRDRGRVRVDASGAVHCIGAVTDVTAESSAQTRYAALNERLRVAAASLGFGVYEFDFGSARAYFSAEARDMFGAGPGDEIAVDELGIPLAVVAEDAAIAERAMHSALDPEGTGELSCELRIRRPDGALRWLQMRAKLFFERRDARRSPTWATGVLFDVTGRREGEVRLRGRDSRLRHIMRTSPVGIVFARLTGEILDCNEAFLRMLGYRADEVDATTLDWRSLRIGADRTDEVAQEMAATGAIAPVEIQLRRRDGSTATALATGVRFDPTLDEHVAFIFDMTPMREAAEQLERVAADLRETNALLDAIFASAPVGLAFWDREFRFRRVNPRLAEFNGRPAAEHIGRTPAELLPGIADMDGIIRLWREVIERRRTHVIEVRGTTPYAPDRPHVWREHLFPVEIDGEVVGGSAFIEDVTESRLAEERLREEEQRYRRIFEQTTTSTWELDLSAMRTRLLLLPTDGLDVATYLMGHPDSLREVLALLRIRSVNPATLQMLGVSSAEELAARLADLLTDEAWAVFACVMADLAQGQPELRAETTLRTVHGRELHVLARARLPTLDERADQVLLSLLDVTALKDAEAVLREANQRKDEFLAMLAHELRNPLAPIRNAAEALRLVRSDEPVVRWARDLIERQVHHLAHIVDDLLDVSRIVQGKVVLHRVPLDVRAVVRSAIETSRSVIDARGHAVLLEMPEEPLPVEGDFVRLTQVVGNLLTNAAKYTKEGGRVTVSMRADDGQVVLRVKDTGEGIARDLLPQVFDLFTQAHRTIDRSQGGLGIGLTVVKRLVEMHGGQVAVWSEGPGRGAEFTIRLPRATAPLPTSTPDEPPRAVARTAGPVRVLVVDDNPDAADSLAQLLRLSGYEVQTAGDGTSALRATESFRPEVALLDLGLPGMDGFELARRMRQLGPTKAALLVAVTGYGREEDVREARAAGFDHHLVKPVDLAALRTLLDGAG